MILSISVIRKAVWIIVPLTVLLVMGGCAGIQPYEPRNHREEGPEDGLFSGSEGEFVILEKGIGPVEDSEDKKSPNEPESTAQPEPAVDENGRLDKSSTDTP